MAGSRPSLFRLTPSKLLEKAMPKLCGGRERKPCSTPVQLFECEVFKLPHEAFWPDHFGDEEGLAALICMEPLCGEPR